MANGSQYYERHRTALHKPDGLLVTYAICNTYQNKYVKTELESPFLMYGKAIHNTRNETNHGSANNTFFFFKLNQTF